VQERLDAVVDRAVATMREEIPAYAAAPPAFFADVRHQVYLHYSLKLDRLLGEEDVSLDDLRFARGAAMRRARLGFALEDFINAFRVGQQVFWEAVVEAAGPTAQGREAALTLATPLMRYCDFASTHAGHAERPQRLQAALAQRALVAVRARQAEQPGERPGAGGALRTDYRVLQRGQPLEQPDALQRAGDAAAGEIVRSDAVQGLSVPAHGALVRAHEPADHVEQRRLAGPVGTDHADHLARPDGQRHAVEGGQAPEAHGDTGHVQRGHLPKVPR
jgi:hypothetical protein